MSEQVEHVEVRFERKWQPGALMVRKRDGWCRVVVRGREMTFAPHEVRTTTPTDPPRDLEESNG